MKKTYKQPDIKIVVVEMESLMAPTMSIGGKDADGTLAPKHDISLDNDFDGKEKDFITGPSNSISTDKMNDYSIKK